MLRVCIKALCTATDVARMNHASVFKRLFSKPSKYLNAHSLNNKTALIKQVLIYETEQANNVCSYLSCY
jgi:hypothetical protein